MVVGILPVQLLECIGRVACAAAVQLQIADLRKREVLRSQPCQLQTRVGVRRSGGQRLYGAAAPPASE